MTMINYPTTNYCSICEESYDKFMMRCITCSRKLRTRPYNPGKK